MKNIVKIFLTLLGTLSLISFSGNFTGDQVSANESSVLKIGTVGVSEQPAQIIAEGLEEKGHEVEVIVFDNVNMPATALMDEEIDLVMANVITWMNTFMSEHEDADFTMLEPYFYVSPTSIYSAKWDSLEELPDGTVFVISNDPSNRDFALRLIEEAGLIELGEMRDAFYSELDIVENPKNIEFHETEVTATARALEDADATVSTAIVAKNTGVIDPNDYLYRSSTANPISPFINTVDLDEPWVNDVIDILSSDETKEKFNEIVQGSFVLWDEYQESIEAQE